MLHHNYRASGKAPAAGIALYAAGGLLASCLIEILYVYLMGFVSNLLLRLIILAGTLALLGAAQVLMIRVGRIRRIRLVKSLSLVILALTYYVGRCVYVSMAQGFYSQGSQEVQAAVLQMDLPVGSWLKLLINPGAVARAMVNILPYGLFSVNGIAIRGIFLLILWIMEWVLMLGIPFLITVYYAGRPYDEERNVWYGRKEEWPVLYVSNYREIRSQMRKGNCAALLDAMKNLKGYKMRGQESYAILEFYRHGKFTGPYVSLTNVKAVQSGPRKLDHRLVTLCRLFDIGAEEAQRLHDQVEASFESASRAVPENEGQKIGDKISMAQFQVSRAGVNVASEVRRTGREKEQQYTVRPAVIYETAELPTVEDVSIHVPRVTPEMEKEYLDRMKTKE